jgi:hypothetical protein
MDEAMRDCIEECSTCHDICVETIVHCLTIGERHSDEHVVRTLMDCAEICQTSANFMLRRSDLHAHTCAACAAVCERCAQVCEHFAGDADMQACAQACRTCAESCRRMASMARAA